MAAPIIIDDYTPPTTLTYIDSKKSLVDEITKQLIKWIGLGSVPPLPVPADMNQLYLIIPPIQTHIQEFNNDGDPTGLGIQGFHNEGFTDPPSSPPYLWAIVKTETALDQIYEGDLSKADSKDGGLDFVGGVGGAPNDGAYGIAAKVAHELVEQFADRNGTFKEIGDPCNNTTVNYRGWSIQQYWSEWDGACINGDAPVSMRKFLSATGFDFNKGLLSLGKKVINVDYIASVMQSH
jgi:hypothetical protein